jgi:hypothetical protein
MGRLLDTVEVSPAFRFSGRSRSSTTSSKLGGVFAFDSLSNYLAASKTFMNRHADCTGVVRA